MSKTIAALYDHIANAHSAVRDLENHPSFNAQDLSVISQDSDRRYSRYVKEMGLEGSDPDTTTTEQGAGTGAGVGAAVGALAGLLVGTSMLVLPGVGAIMALGPIGATLAGAGVGAAVGGLTGALIGFGIEHSDAQMYSEAVRRGASLVLVRAAEADVAHAVEILEKYSPVDIEKRREHWRTMGWEEHDEEADPYSVDQIKTEYDSYPEEVRSYRPGLGVRHYGSPRQLFDVSDPALQDDFSRHYNEHPASSSELNHAEAYNIGSALAQQDKYRKMKWEEAQAQAHKMWAREHDQRDEHWEEVKDRVQYAWHKTRSKFMEKTL